MTDNEHRRRELGAFLRSRRERIDPETVGLPTGRRRRTSGLRREEVAVLAGLSPTWYTYLEQGRDIHPSHEVLDSLVRMLQLNDDERSYIYLLAYGQRPVKDSPLREANTEAILWQIADAYKPSPVYVANQVADVLTWNAAATEWYTDFAKLPDEHRNTVWWTLMEPDARERLVMWDDEAKDVIGRLRAVSAVRPGDRRLSQLIADLMKGSPEMRRWWSDHEIRSQAPRVRWLRHPQLGVRAMNLVVAYPAGMDGIGIAFHLPVPDDEDV